MCAWCGKILNHLFSRRSHGICKDCAAKLKEEFYRRKRERS